MTATKHSAVYASLGYKDDAGVFLESDTDEQLLISIPFNQIVKLHSVQIQGPNDGTAPRVVKLFVNKESMDFGEAEDTKPVQEINLSDADVESGALVPLKFVSFQYVRRLVLFVQSNTGGGDITRMSKLSLLGMTVDTTNMNDWGKHKG